MHKTIRVTELQQHLRTVLDEVVRERTPYVLDGDTHPEAALIPYEDFLRLRRLEEREFRERFDSLLEGLAKENAAYSEEEIAADVEAAREEVAGEAAKALILEQCTEVARKAAAARWDKRP